MPLPVVYSQTGTGIIALFYTAYGWVLLALLYVGTIALSKQARRERLIHRVATPLILLLALAVVAISDGPRTNPFFRLRFGLSQTALTDAAARKLAEPSRAVPSWVGLFPVLSTEASDGSVRFITTHCGIVDACGLVYSPDRPPRRVYEDTFVELSSAWYHVYQGF